MKNKVLVLGSTGFIGKNLMDFLVSENYPVVGLSTSRCNFSNLNSFKKSTKNIVKNSTVIFCAGKHRQYGDNIKNYNLNKNIIKNLLIIFKSQKPKKIIFFSTVEVYGNKFLKKIDEDTKINPLNLYAKGKYEQELLIKKFCIKHKIKFNIIRIPGIFGKQDNDTSFISKVISAISKNKVLNFNTNLREKRDYIYIDDLVKALKLIIDSNFLSGSYNLVSGKSYSIEAIVKKIEKIYKKKLKYKLSKKNGFNLVFSNKKIKKSIKKIKFNSLEKNIHLYKKKYDTCVIGYGPWAKKIIKILRKKDNSFNLVGICRKKKEKDHKNKFFFLNIEKMIKKCKPKVIFLISTPQVNLKMLNFFKNKNLPIFLEKPTALNQKSLLQVNKFISSNKIVHINYMDMINPLNNEILYRLSGKKPIKFVGNLSSSKKNRKSHSPLWDYAPHFLALLLNFYRKMPRSVKANIIKITNENKKLFKIKLDFGKQYQGSSIIAGNGNDRNFRNFTVFLNKKFSIKYDDFKHLIHAQQNRKKIFNFRTKLKLLDHSIKIFEKKIIFSNFYNDKMVNSLVTNILISIENSIKNFNWEKSKG